MSPSSSGSGTSRSLASNKVNLTETASAPALAMKPTHSAPSQTIQTSVSKEDMQARAQLRKKLRVARRELSSEQHEDAAKRIALQLNALPFLNEGTTIAGYLVNDGEVNLKYYINSVWQASSKKRFTLPVLHPVCKGHLLFLAYNPNTQLIWNKYNIEEPVLACKDVVPVTQCDVILMPLVGFDNNGNRLGMGGGYYDRTLSFIQRQIGSHSPLKKRAPKLVGIAHDIQEVDALPIAPWDVPLDAIVTPTRTLHFTNS